MVGNDLTSRSIRKAIMPLVALMVWLALIFAMFFHQLRDPSVIGIVFILGVGALGAVILGRQVVRRFRQSDRGGQ